MSILYETTLTRLSNLDIQAERSEIVTWQGRQALRLENGLALIPDQSLANASLEVMIGVEKAAYPGLAFRLADKANYELAYAVPHASGLWDAIQYDPVFHGSNTWQIYYGPAYQQSANIPVGEWFRLKVAFHGQRAAIAVDGQPPLIVERLAYPPVTGRFGLWTFLPAHFCDLRVSPCEALDVPPGVTPVLPAGAVTAWFVEGFGVVTCEPNGAVNLNRFLPAALGEARLTRQFELVTDTDVAFSLGFSDALKLELDGATIFEGETRFSGFADRPSRGYAETGTHSVQQRLTPGLHRLTATVRISEPYFGWGLVLAAQGEGIRWLTL